MADRSDKKEAFIGLFVTPETKEHVERTAEEEGVSISEAVRRRLKDLEATAEKRAATT